MGFGKIEGIWEDWICRRYKVEMLFYTIDIAHGLARLDEEESRHLLTVLRRGVGDAVSFTDGKGRFYDAEIAEAGKKQAVLRIVSETVADAERPARLHLAIAPTKNIDRIEWLLEKATEIGVDKITLLHCKRSERTVVRLDRLQKVLVSAMKQSMRATLPELVGPVLFKTFVETCNEPLRCIGWLPEEMPPHLTTFLKGEPRDVVVAIGPEGDFTPEEVAMALEKGFEPVSLGKARLRTETAGLYAVTGVVLGWERK